MRAGYLTNGIGHCHNGEAKGEADAGEPDVTPSHHGRADAKEDKNEGADGFGHIFFHGVAQFGL